MPPPDAPKVVMVPVKRYDINLTLHDILTPLTQMAQAGQAPSAGPDVQQHVQQLSDLAGQLRGERSLGDGSAGRRRPGHRSAGIAVSCWTRSAPSLSSGVPFPGTNR